MNKINWKVAWLVLMVVFLIDGIIDHKLTALSVFASLIAGRFFHHERQNIPDEWWRH